MNKKDKIKESFTEKKYNWHNFLLTEMQPISQNGFGIQLQPLFITVAWASVRGYGQNTTLCCKKK